MLMLILMRVIAALTGEKPRLQRFIFCRCQLVNKVVIKGIFSVAGWDKECGPAQVFARLRYWPVGQVTGVGSVEGVAEQEGAQGGAVAVQPQNGGATRVSTALLKGKRGEDQRAAPGFSVQIYSGELIELSRTVCGLICSTASCRPS